jgi:F-type H+-transporting ATPase subunit alpha
MKQPQYAPLSVAEQALTLLAVNRGYYDDIDVKNALSFEAGLRAFIKGTHAALIDKIESTKDMDADTEKALVAAIEDFKKNSSY